MRDLSSKRTVLALALVAAVIALVASGRTWITGTLNDGVLANNGVQVTGNQAVPGYVVIALVACAGLLAAATAGRIVRWPSAVVSLAASVSMLVLSCRTLADPASALKGRMTAVTGHNGEAVARGEFTLWFWTAVFGAVLSLVASLLGLIGLRRWRGLSSRYEAPVDADAGSPKSESDWDLMSRGVDPTEGR